TRASLGVQHLFTLLTGNLYGLDSLDLRQVASKLGVADEATGIVAKGGDRDVGPKCRSVLAHTPSGIDEAAFFPGYLQLVLGPPALFRLGRVKHREMLADDLTRAVALDPFRRDV